MFFESKWKIFELVPEEFYPTTFLVQPHNDIISIEQRLINLGIRFPVIAKPDRGERGWAVKKLSNITELHAYKASLNVSFLIQSYVDYPVELSVFYYRHPSQKKGVVTSVTLKKFLAVTGDGKSSIKDLILRNDRCFLQYEKLLEQKKTDFSRIPLQGEEVVLVPYGNHVLGATFINYNHIIDDELCAVFDTISHRIDGFYFGLYDLRCASVEDLKTGINFSILEVNGSGAEPSHIYEPGFSFFKGQLVIARHFHMMYLAAKENKKRGNRYMTFNEFRHTKRLEKEYKLNVSVI